MHHQARLAAKLASSWLCAEATAITPTRSTVGSLTRPGEKERTLRVCGEDARNRRGATPLRHKTRGSVSWKGALSLAPAHRSSSLKGAARAVLACPEVRCRDSSSAGLSLIAEGLTARD